MWYIRIHKEVESVRDPNVDPPVCNPILTCKLYGNWNYLGLKFIIIKTLIHKQSSFKK